MTGRARRALAAAALVLHLVAVGHGFALDPRLAPPTAVRYADPALYDVVSAGFVEGERLILFVELGATDPSEGLPIGITQAIVELYLDLTPGGAGETLPGSGMSMPPGTGWDIAVRITGDGAWAWSSDAWGGVDLMAPLPVEVEVSGRTLVVHTPFEALTGQPRLFVVTGVYDPFAGDGWRPLSGTPSPWAFSSEELVRSAIDVFPGDAAAVAKALEDGVFPHRGRAASAPARSALWITLMLLGLAVALSGLWWRRFGVRGDLATGAAPTPAPERPAAVRSAEAPSAERTAAVTAATALRRLRAEAWLIDEDDLETSAPAGEQPPVPPELSLVRVETAADSPRATVAEPAEGGG
jgi:hypothetical protein